MDTSTRSDRVSILIAIILILVGLYAGLYFAFRRAGWIRDTGYFHDSNVTWIEASERTPWLEWPYRPAMRLEELFRGYAGKPVELK